MDIVGIVEELMSLPATGTRVPGFRRKVLVDTDRLAELAAQLRDSVPAEIREAQEIIKQRESIISQAHLESQRVKGVAGEEASEVAAAAHREHETKVDESEIVQAAGTKAQEVEDEAMTKAQQIVQEAQKRAYLTVNKADATAGTLREGADRYAREVLFNLEEQLATALGQVRSGIDKLGVEAEVHERVEEREPVGEPVPA